MGITTPGNLFELARLTGKFRTQHQAVVVRRHNAKEQSTEGFELPARGVRGYAEDGGIRQLYSQVYDDRYSRVGDGFGAH